MHLPPLVDKCFNFDNVYVNGVEKAGNFSQTNAITNASGIKFGASGDDAYDILEVVKPTIIISSLRGDFNAQIIAHTHMLEYIKQHKIKMLYLSSANVFDA